MEDACCELGNARADGFWKTDPKGLIKLLHCFSYTALLVFLPLLGVANDTNGSYSAA